MKNNEGGVFVSLFAGGAAGFSVDVTLFPLDTIKTRLQSKVGFRAAGGLRRIYSGLGPAALGSAPNAAAFFCTYEYSKRILKPYIPEKYGFCSYSSAATLGEIAACIIRVPTEVIKQRRQTSLHSSFHIFRTCLRQEGILGLYRGYWTTVMREIPFSFIQYPLWEFFKKTWSKTQNRAVTSWESALSGALAGGIAAALTTPLDVAKTRIMLADVGTKEAKGNILSVLSKIYLEKGVKGMYSGIIPRSLWMSFGGAIYFGVYEFTKQVIS